MLAVRSPRWAHELIGNTYARRSISVDEDLLDSRDPLAARRGAPAQEEQATPSDVTMTILRRATASDIISGCTKAGRSKHLACFGDDLLHSEHRSARAPRRRQARPSRLTGAWRRRRKRPTRTSRAGEGLDRVHYVPARPRPLGEHGGEPHGLRFTRTFRTSRIAAVVHGREATLKNCTAHHRIFSRVWDRFLRPLGPTSNIWPRGINYFTSRSRDIHTSAVTARLARKG